jgi:hypothetical protein
MSLNPLIAAVTWFLCRGPAVRGPMGIGWAGRAGAHRRCVSPPPQKARPAVSGGPYSDRGPTSGVIPSPAMLSASQGPKSAVAQGDKSYGAATDKHGHGDLSDPCEHCGCCSSPRRSGPLVAGVRSRPAHARCAGAPTGVAPCRARRSWAIDPARTWTEPPQWPHLDPRQRATIRRSGGCRGSFRSSCRLSRPHWTC